jgi:hypothetical protein
MSADHLSPPASLHECFSVSKYWKSYDVFFRQSEPPVLRSPLFSLNPVFLPTECETFSRSGDAVFELSTRFVEPFVIDSKLSPEMQLDAKKLLFHELTQVTLWGNATDLSLLINVRMFLPLNACERTSLTLRLTQMTEDDIKKLQSTGGDHLAATEKNILGNHLSKVWDLVSSPTFAGDKKGGRVDIGERLPGLIALSRALVAYPALSQCSITPASSCSAT